MALSSRPDTPVTQVAPTPGPERLGGRVDLTAYFDRIGLTLPQQANGDALRAIQRHHVATIPFENLDVLLGREISLDLTDLEEKLVRRRRGGYCYEHNSLLADLLEQLGYDVQPLVGRVNPSRPGPRSHMLLRVHDGHDSWLVDVGLGMDAQPVEPIPFDAAGRVELAGWRYRIVAGSFSGARRLQVERHDRWQTLYEFTEEPHHAIDYEMYNYNASTSPDSPFVRRLVVQTNHGTLRRRLTANGLSSHRAPFGSDPQVHAVAGGRLGEMLTSTFGIGLDSCDVEALVGHLA